MTADPRLTPEERAKVIRLLHQSQQAFLDAVEGLSDAQWAYKPEPTRWCVGEVAEHVLLTEAVLFATVERTLTQEPDPQSQATTATKDDFVERLLLNRQGRARAPERIQPRGELARGEILDRYRKMRAKTLEFAEHTDQPLKAVARDHPFPIFGTLNAYQWLLYIPFHNMRHIQQIKEVKSSAGFPG